MDYEAVFHSVIADERYRRNLGWGKPRRGHPEGTVQAHIEELESNLTRLRRRLSDTEFWKLRILIHTHDTFKADAQRRVAIIHPASHASLARSFLAEFCADQELLTMVQHHDEAFALWRQGVAYDRQRFDSLIATIGDWDLFLAFHIIDGCTMGKSREPLRWFFAEIRGSIESRCTKADILD